MLSALKNSAIAWQLRRSWIWKRYRQPSERRHEIKFYKDLVNASEPGCIIDVGASNGSKTEIFLTLASRVIAIEPDPVSVRILRKRFRWKPVVVREVAISSVSGTVPLYHFGAGSAFNTVSADWAKCMTDGANHMRLKSRSGKFGFMTNGLQRGA
jgi:hypothetical protein